MPLNLAVIFALFFVGTVPRQVLFLVCALLVFLAWASHEQLRHVLAADVALAAIRAGVGRPPVVSSLGASGTSSETRLFTSLT